MNGDARTPAITLHRPWAACITDLPAPWAKRVENRTWTRTWRGPILIHAGQTWDRAGVELATRIAADNNTELRMSARPDDHPTGVVAVAELVDICSTAVDGGRCGCGPWAFPGRHHWLLGNVRRLARPVPCLGMQGMWWPSGTVLDAVAAQLGAVTP